MRQFALLVLACALHTTGCATLFTGDRQEVVADSPSPGYRVTIDGVPRGETPLRIALDKTKSHSVVITGPDGKVFSCELSATVGVGWVILDLINLTIIPLIVDAVTGKWKSLDSTACISPYGHG